MRFHYIELLWCAPFGHLIKLKENQCFAVFKVY